jgi:hypothetical protein
MHGFVLTLCDCGAGIHENLQYVFGNMHPLYWFLPSFRGPPERMKLTKGA